MADLEIIDPKSLPQGLPTTKFLASQIMEEMNYNPIRRLIEMDEQLAEWPDGDPQTIAMQIGIAKELAKYYAPTLRAVDVTINQQSTMTVNITRFDYGQLPPPAEGGAAGAAVVKAVAEAVMEDEDEDVDDTTGD